LVWLGSSAHIADTLKKVAGSDEVILWVNVGLRLHGQVKNEMGALHGRGGTAGGRA
jgi:hypothetical protein